MNVEYKRLDIKSIDLTDTTFVISYGFPLSALKESIRKIGLINPPLVKKGQSEGYRVVCGYRRLLVCREIGTETLMCAVTGHNIEDRDALLISLYDNLSHRDLNPIEKSIAVGKLQSYYPEGIIVKDFLPLLRLNPHHSVLRKTRYLSRLNGEMKDAVVAGTLDEGAAIKLLNFSEKDRMLVFELLSKLKLSRNKQNEVIDNIDDITRRDECSVSSILDSKDLKHVLDDKNLNIPQKGRRVRDVLRGLRYPKIVNAEKDFLEIRRGLDLKEGIKLTPPPFFEGGKYSIDFQFGTIDELEENLKKIGSIKHNKGFKRAIEG